MFFEHESAYQSLGLVAGPIGLRTRGGEQDFSQILGAEAGSALLHVPLRAIRV